MVIEDLFRLNPSFVEVFIFNPNRHRCERKMDHALLVKVAP